MQSNPQYNSLIEMGCSPVLVETSIRKLKTQDLDKLLDWISDHSEEQQKWAQWLKENQGSNEGQSINQLAQQGQSIEPLINKEMRTALISKGHSKNVSEKSLLLTNNVSVQSAQKWIEQHKYDQDFEQQLRLQGQAYNASTLSPEEAKAKLQQLTKKAREVRKQRQQEEERQRQRNRVKFTKEMQAAKRLTEEAAMKRQVELDRIQKQKDEQYKQRLLEDMRREKNAKLGIKEEPGKTVTTQAKKEEPKLSKLQQVEIQCEQVKVGNHAYPDIAKTFFETAQIYVNNIIKNNGEQKFRRINKDNKAFQNRICQAFGGVEFLHVLGYQEEDNSLVLRKYNLDELKRVGDILQRYRAWY